LRLIEKVGLNNSENEEKEILKILDKSISCIEILKRHDDFKINYTYNQKENKKENKKENIDLTKIKPEEAISIDTGVTNLMTIYDPTGKQIIIKGGFLIHNNNIFNSKIDNEISNLSVFKLKKKNKFTAEEKTKWVKGIGDACFMLK
jgi:hypothetical protein